MKLLFFDFDLFYSYSNLVLLYHNIKREKPVIDYASISPEKSTQLVPQDQKKSNNPESNGDNDLPHGWIASVVPVSGDEYYFNEGTGETTW